MFTLRIVYDDGRELVVTALQVTADPADLAFPAMGYSRVAWLEPDGSKHELEYGDVYVMNSNGKTVADYHIRPPKTSEPA